MNYQYVALILVVMGLASLPVEATETTPDFNRDVAPILVKRCLECHQNSTASGNLKLVSHADMIEGGDSGPVLEPGDVEGSLLFERILDGEMPPELKGKSQKLPDDEIDVIKRWIEAGAAWPDGRTLDLYEATSEVRGGRDWWSFQPIRRPEVPSVKSAERIANPIDAFVLARLESENMQPAPPAGKRTLLRRVYYDMIGLPPTFEQTAAYVADRSDDAWEKVVDQLLDSPQYGERWARYWLDLVRFAETCGYERDQTKPGAWKYRDWVVQSLNDDKPFDCFILEQLAGDELPDRSKETVIATGFLRLGTWNDEPNDPQDYKYERLEDLVHSTASAFLALTVKCARCHDHKFDPIPQEDYYRMASVFWAGPIQPRGSKLLGGPTSDELGFDDVLGWTDVGPRPAALHLLQKGERHRPAQAVEPGPMTAVPAMFRLFDPPAKDAKTSGRRLQLASWIADKKNPLPARVFVNRLWQHHFGEGLVRTPNNFGFRGAAPTHPKLLDWLAAEFLAGGGKIKRIHKLILTSDAYRQSVLHPRYREYEVRDSSNQLWWRAERRRLDAEALRDSMLAVSGELDLRMGGPSFRPTIQAEALEGLSKKTSAWQASSSDQQRRRSLYIFTKRGLLPPMMTTFDFSDTTLPCGKRDVTTVATQALAMMNNQFSHQRSTALARRVFESGHGESAQVIEAWRLALGRLPSNEERKLASAHLERQKQRFAARLASQEQAAPNEDPESELVVKQGLALHLRADSGLKVDEQQRVAAWTDMSPGGRHAEQSQPELRPLLVKDALNGRPALRFQNGRRLLNLRGTVLSSEHCTLIAVVTDRGNSGHREIISNWNSNGNTTSSMFLGLTGENTVRFSDAFAAAGQVAEREKPFILTGVNHPGGAEVYQNASPLASRPSTISGRRLAGPWVIGEQGNLNGETWNGDVAEILAYNRPLKKRELAKVWSYLGTRYGVPAKITVEEPVPEDPALLALASLCHVLLNSNEFLYVD
jgi:hypothetical protein